MTNEKLGVLLVDVPELMYFDYVYIMDIEQGGEIKFTVNETDLLEEVVEVAYKCTQEEAKKYPQFRWVALEELE
ncbi:hypothetical protein QQY84_03620 [Streptococcus suis]|uniref:hypothetical protein n=1 Tax=Streptococcus suis TaxID=1307 RepID=UPI000D0AF34D|nr:hypothetical protein [Streptococcus suis]MBS7854639.1 hypothetical protein [Streptococcus suis]MBS7977698.1 hypothetical protein [Streptococcus suis]MDG3109157.1 hypothetical protein [Streptococcus suis]MDG3147981.1 hypothetical protein [Streptococcus suis]MDG3170301.1 hypothetical protein [Streptococcus suis]